MNYPLSELVSWILESVADNMDSSELISVEDLKSLLDNINEHNVDKPKPTMHTSTVNLMNHADMIQSDSPPKLCDCQVGCCEPPEPKYENDDIPPSTMYCQNVTWVKNRKSDEGGPNQPEDHCEPSPSSTDGEGVNTTACEDDLRMKQIHEDLSESCVTINRPTNSKSFKMKQKREKFKEQRKSRLCEKQQDLQLAMVSAKDVPTELVQDMSKPLVIIGSDVVSLYPNLTWESAGEAVYHTIVDSDIVWQGVNFKEGVRYLALCRGYDWCLKSNLHRVLPWRRYAHGSWPGITGEGPMGPTSDDEEQWCFSNVQLTDLEKKRIIGEIMRLSVEVSFKTHVYSFRTASFKQKDGGPIGMRSTCAIARVSMGYHSILWKQKMDENNIQIEGFGFYVDDGRVVMYPLRAGWRWVEGGLWFCEQWELEDRDLSDVQRTKNAVGASLDGLVECLTFTVETCEDYDDGFLPTLDLNIKVDDDGEIVYKFYEKPTSSQVCLQADTAMAQNGLVQALVEDTKRRLYNTSSKIDMASKVEMLDKWAQKMVNSGHTQQAARRNILAGLKGWRSKVNRCLKEGKKLHRSAKESSDARRLRKLVGKNNWFRKPAGEAVDEGETVHGGPGQHPGPHHRSGVLLPPFSFSPASNMDSDQEKQSKPEGIRTTSVLFVEHTRGGVLASNIRKTLANLEPMTGFRVKVVENGGTSLGSLFSNKNPWAGQKCGRTKCTLCKQNTERVEGCTTTNLVYESACVVCNGEEKIKNKEGLEDKREEPSIYVGESARSIMERGLEHQKDYNTMKEDNHMLKHWSSAHPNDQRPKFNMFVVKSYKSCLERQVGEAVCIQLRGNTLNSRAEGAYNRCKVTRLVVDTEWDRKSFAANFKASSKSVEADTLEKDGEVGLEEKEVVENQKKGNKRKTENIAKKVSNKRRKVEDLGIKWGESIVRAEPAKQEFLSDSNNIPLPAMLVQTKLNAMKSPDLISRVIVREIIGEAVRISREAAENNWDAYNDDIVDEEEVWAMETPLSKAAVDKLERLKKKREKEEEFLCKMLKELDIKSRKAEENSIKAKLKKISDDKKLAAKNKGLVKISEFFSKKKKPEQVEDMEVDHPDVEHVVEVKEMEVDEFSWKERDKCSRKRRAALQKKQTLSLLNTRTMLKEWLKEVLLSSTMNLMNQEVKTELVVEKGNRFEMLTNVKVEEGDRSWAGIVKTKGKVISWEIGISVESAVEALEKERRELRDWLAGLVLDKVYENVKVVTIKKKKAEKVSSTPAGIMDLFKGLLEVRNILATNFEKNKNLLDNKPECIIDALGRGVENMSVGTGNEIPDQLDDEDSDMAYAGEDITNDKCNIQGDGTRRTGKVRNDSLPIQSEALACPSSFSSHPTSLKEDINQSLMDWSDNSLQVDQVSLKRKRNTRYTHKSRVCLSVDPNQHYCFFDHYIPSQSVPCKVCDHQYRRLLDSQQEALSVSMAGSEFGVMPDNALADIGGQEAIKEDCTSRKDNGKKKYILVPQMKNLFCLNTERLDTLNARVVSAANRVVATYRSTQSTMETRPRRMEDTADTQTVDTYRNISKMISEIGSVASLPVDREFGGRIVLAPARLDIRVKPEYVKRVSQEQANIMTIEKDCEMMDTAESHSYLDLPGVVVGTGLNRQAGLQVSPKFRVWNTWRQSF